jgi:hypothetical protein
MAKRIRPGDVIEIPTSRGLCYAHYSLKKNQWGALLRILPGFFAQRPKNICALVKEKEKFVTFFPLQAAVNRKIFEVVEFCEVPESARDFPLFRAAGYVDRDGKVHDWWLWDGEREWRIGTLTSEQLKLPIRSVINDTLLIEEIEGDWTPETDPRTLRSMTNK